MQDELFHKGSVIPKQFGLCNNVASKFLVSDRCIKDGSMVGIGKVAPVWLKGCSNCS
jgi:hypothetical protein